MTLEPIIRAKVEQYKKDYLLNDLEDDEIFERFTNMHILSQLEPGAFSIDVDLLDAICIGNGNDMGLDGIAVLLNGRIVKSKEDVEDILIGNRRGKFEFVFIQAKNRGKYELGDYMKFTSGVEGFLENEISMPANDEVMKWHELFNYIMSNEVIIKWSENPSIKLYYVVAGGGEKSEHILSYSDTVRQRLCEKRCFETIDSYIIDSKSLVEIINSNENNYTAVMNFVDSIPLPEIDRVENSSFVLCNAKEMVGLLSTSDGLLRRNLFEDNVRDFQGETVINNEIKETLETNAEKFILLNNGITIVCDEMKEGNRKISIKNPQIVNGCQTCNVLFNCSRNGVELDNAYVIVKVIGSDNADIINNIVKGTNRQNIVYEEAFEITKEFHKLLEKFFATMEQGEFEKLYYERRAKQYDNNLLVKPQQKVNFRIMIQSVVSLFLFKVEIGHRHESRLLNDYSNQIFASNQSFYPYYTAAFIYMQIERLFKSRQLPKVLYPYKLHIMLVLKEMLAGKSPNINKQKEIDKYCVELLAKIDTESKMKKAALDACEKFESIMNEWIKLKGDSYRYAIKDSIDYKEFMLESLRGRRELANKFQLRGQVLNINTDKNGDFFGFIQKSPQNIFFHEKQNPGLAIDYEKKDVLYSVEKRTDGREYAIGIKLAD